MVKSFKISSILKRILIVLMMVITIVSLFLSIKTKKSGNSFIGNSELMRAMTYEQFADGDENIEGTENVKFSAFFLRDINNDGYADKLKGTCKEIAEAQDTLYMEINVLTAGQLKNAVIQIDSKNFYLETSLPKDNELKQNYISTNTTTIEFENLGNGTQKLLSGEVKSGDYSKPSTKKDAIGNNINNYSRNDNRIILTGTYVAPDLSETPITKIIPLTIDWYGTSVAEIKNKEQTRYDLPGRIDSENETFRATFSINSEETKNQLNNSKYYVQGTIPQLNGFDPISVTRTNDDGEFTYDNSTKGFIITKESEIEASGAITKSVSRYQADTIEVIYPLEAYETLGVEEAAINIPISIYYEGYNNPNPEFSNPYKSNTATATIVAKYMPEITTATSVDIKVGRNVVRPTHHYMVSKAKPIRLFEGISSEEYDDCYIVAWKVCTGTNGDSTGLTIKETTNNSPQRVDTFIKNDSTEVSMETITSNVGVYFSNASGVLGSNGEIKVYDEETGILLHTFTSNDWGKYTSTNPYKYDTPVKHIKIVTSATTSKTTLNVYNVKEIDDDKIIKTYTRDQFDDFSYIKSYVAAYLGNTYIGTQNHQANYEAPYSVARISTDTNVLSTQVTQEGMNLYIDTEVDASYNQVGWVNGTYLVRIPNEILETNINTVTVNNLNVSIISYEIIEISTYKFIKINTSNINAESYRITINVDMTPDPRNSSSNNSLKLYAQNEYCNNYYYSEADLYDIDGDNNTTELVNMTSKNLSFVAPNSMLTNQTISDFDNHATVVVSPEIANLTPIYGSNPVEKQTAKIGIQIKNNYSSTISETVILGKIPFEGNRFVMSGGDLESEFTTSMTSAGIIVPSALQNSISVFYSTNAAPTKDLSDTNNGWTSKQNISDWSAIKTWMIDFGDTVISQGAEYIFYYTVEVPNGLGLNDTAYSHHGIYFCLDTPEGKYRTQTEPNKIGIRIADKYNLVLTKYQKNKSRLVQGATYRVSKLDNSGNIEESQTAITNASGVLEMANLYAEKVYEIKEIQTPTNYSLNSDVIKIIGHVDMLTGNLIVEKVQGTTRDNLQVTKNTGEDYKVRANVEDEANVTLNLRKLEQGTSNTISGVRYKITGSGLPTNGKNLKTSNSGEFSINGLKVGEEYTLEEKKADGYYITNPIIVKVDNNQGTYSLSIVQGTVKTNSLTIQNDIPVVNIEVEDEKIPLFNISVSKIEKGTGVDGVPAVPINGAKFKLFKDNIEIGSYITNSSGNFSINNLYQHVEGKEFDATYVLKEIYAPEGYAKVSDITFKGQVVDNNLIFVSEQTDKFTTIGSTINLTIEDSPSFKLIKKDGETNALLPNVKFAIYDVATGEEPARNSKGEIIGTKETINGKEYYTVTTNANGEVTADLPEGYYKAVEVDANEKYEISNTEEYFGIGKGQEGNNIPAVRSATTVGNDGTESIVSAINTSDDGYIVCGTYTSSTIPIGSYTITNNGGYDSFIIKYDSDDNVEWATTFGDSGDDCIKSMSETQDGGFIIGGYYNSSSISFGNSLLTNTGGKDGFLLKYDNNYTLEWAKSLPVDSVECVCGTSDEGYILGCKHESSNLSLDGNIYSFKRISNVILIKYDNNDEVEWLNNICASSYVYINSLTEISDDKFAIGGNWGGMLYVGDSTFDSINNGEGYLIKYDDNEIEWITTYIGSSSDTVYTICGAADGRFCVGVHTTSSSLTIGNQSYSVGNNNALLIEYNADNTICEIKQFIGNASIKLIRSTKDNGFVVVGGLNEDEMKIDDYTIMCSLAWLQGNDLYIVKLTGDLEVEWGTTFGGASSREAVNNVLETQAGEYIVCGIYTGTRVVANDELLVGDGSQDGLIVRYSPSKNPSVSLQNVRKISGPEDEFLSVLCPMDDGSYIVGGRFENAINIGNQTLTSVGDSDIFVAKYNNKHNFEWAYSFGSDSGDNLMNISSTIDGGYIVSGRVGRSIVVEGFALKNYFIIKYDENNEIEWVNTIEGSIYSSLASIQKSNNEYTLLGSFEGNLTIGNTVLTSVSNRDIFIIKYNYDGTLESAQSIETSGDYSVSSMCLTSDGGIILAGYNDNTFTIKEYTFTSTGNYHDVFLIKFDRANEIEWTDHFGGIEREEINSICQIEDGSYIVGGKFYDSLTIGCFDMKSGQSVDSFIAKYKSSGAVEWARSFSSYAYDEITSVNATRDGGYVVSGYFHRNIKLGGYTCSGADSRTYSLVIKYDKNDKIEWTSSWGGINGHTNGNRVYCLNNGSYIATGTYYMGGITIGNTTLENEGGFDVFIVNLVPNYWVPESEEIVLENSRKEYTITTDIEEIDSIKGGTISGEDSDAFEKVKYGDNSTIPIVMTPDMGYEIISIKINGEEWNYQPNNDDTYTIESLTNVTEDKHIIVKYALKDNKITINKIDSISNQPIEGVSFALDQIEERDDPSTSSILGTLTDNGKAGLLTMQNNGEYYFVENNEGKLVPTNSKTYQLANGGTAGIADSTASSYIPIDLTKVSGDYVLTVNASCSCNSRNCGYAIITDNTNAPSYNAVGRFMYVYGTKESRDYTFSNLTGRNRYFLHLGYKKDGSYDTGDDQVIINSITLSPAITDSYSFIDNAGIYESTNQGINNTTCNSYISMDMTNYSGKYLITVNAEISTQNGDYGYVTLNQSTLAPTYDSELTSDRKILCISGTTTAQNYAMVIDGGYQYYLHLGYYKDNVTNIDGDDKFKINSINISLSDSGLYHTTITTNSGGQAITQIPFGKYQVSEINVSENYWPIEEPEIIEFRSNNNAQHEFTIQDEKKSKVIVHHYIKNTTTKLVEDQEIYGKVGETYYTSPSTNVGNYTLEKNQLGEYILPNNSSGTNTYNDIEVTYYYVEKQIPLTVHHYIEGTESNVPLANGTAAQDVISSGPKNTTYSTSAIQDSLLDENYELKETPLNASGIFVGDEIVVTYYYKQVERDVIINKVDEDGTTPLDNVKFLLYKPSPNLVFMGNMTNNGTHYMIKQGNKYIPSNIGVNSTTSYSYIPINMYRATSPATLTINAEISSQANNDIGFAIVNTSKGPPSYSTSYGRVLYISGEVEAQDYTMELQPGRLYYLHMGYRKNGSTHSGTDTFTINSISVTGAQVATNYTTDSNGQIALRLKPGTYTLEETSTLSNYSLPSNPNTSITVSKSSTTQQITLTNSKKRGTVVVHHYIQGTTDAVPNQSGGTVDDDTKQGVVGTMYATQPATNVHNYYEPVGAPANSSGEYQDGRIEVIYYYRKVKGDVTITVNKDNESWNNSGMEVALYQNGEEVYSYDDAIVTSSEIKWTNVDVGEYEIYAGKSSFENDILVNTGKTATVE